MLFLSLLRLCGSWFPNFHQHIASEFSLDYFPFLTDSERQLFLTGSIYADALDKSITHHVNRMKDLFDRIADQGSDLYWFFMGVFSHIPPDTFAHAGKSASFIVNRGVKHHLSEFVVDSLINHLYHVPYLRLPKKIREQINQLGIGTRKSFFIIYPIEHLLAKLPFYKFLPWIEQDRCSTMSYPLTLCNFHNHYTAMIEALKQSMDRIKDHGFDDLMTKELATSLVMAVDCCSQQFNSNISDPLDTIDYQFLPLTPVESV